MEELRQSFPAEHTTVYVCKNSLMKIAADQIDGWSTLRSISKVILRVGSEIETCFGFDRNRMLGCLWMKMALHRL